MIPNDWWTKPDWLSAVGTVAAAFASAIALILAFFKATLVRWWNRPRLVVSVRNEPPDCEQTYLTADGQPTPAECYYFRLAVKNRGRARANDVEIFAKELSKADTQGRFHRLPTFPPMDLLWSNVRVTTIGISPDVQKHCDLGAMADPASWAAVPSNNGVPFAFELQVKPNHGGHVIWPGKYRLVIVVAGSNITSHIKTVDLTFTGAWFHDMKKMFSDQGIRISLR